MTQQQKAIRELVRRSRDRKEQHAFVVEGIRLFSEAPKERIRKIVISENFARGKQAQKLLSGMQAETVPDSIFEAISDTKTPQGILAILDAYDYTLEDLLKKPNPLLLVLETIQDPGNLGTMLRAGEAAGITGILMNDTTADIYNPKVVRSTMGSIYRVPFYRSADFKGDLQTLKARGVKLAAAHLQGSVPYDQTDCTGPCAFLIGNEGNGLTEETASMADLRVRIPMCGNVESLNAAMAAGVLLFEAARQRRQ